MDNIKARLRDSLVITVVISVMLIEISVLIQQPMIYLIGLILLILADIRIGLKLIKEIKIKRR